MASWIIYCKITKRMTYLHTIDGNKAVLANYARDLLIEDAIRNYEKVDSESKEKHKKVDSESKEKHKEIEVIAKGKKKKITLDLAASLEGKYREDTIAMVMVLRLKGVVSERLIHHCLPEKYKQKHRVLNAKKQNQKKDTKENEKLAAIPMIMPLNSKKEEEEEEEDEKKPVMLVNVDGTTSIQNDVNRDSDSEGTVTSNSFESSINRQSQWYQQEEQQQLPQEKNYDDEEIEEYSKSNESSLLKDHNLNDNEELEKLDIKENEEISENRINTTTDNDVVNFEFPIPYYKVQKYMTPLFHRSGSTSSVWFHGKMHTKTGRVVRSGVGRIGEENGE